MNGTKEQNAKWQRTYRAKHRKAMRRYMNVSGVVEH